MGFLRPVVFSRVLEATTRCSDPHRVWPSFGDIRKISAEDGHLNKLRPKLNLRYVIDFLISCFTIAARYRWMHEGL